MRALSPRTLTTVTDADAHRRLHAAGWRYAAPPRGARYLLWHEQDGEVLLRPTAKASDLHANLEAEIASPHPKTVLALVTQHATRDVSAA